MVISLRMTEDEKRLAESYAKIHGMSVSEAIKRAFFEKVEEEYDVALTDMTMREYDRNHITLSHIEVKKKLGL